MRPSDVSIEFCHGEQRLHSSCSHNAILAMDVNLSRLLVSQGVLEGDVETIVSSAIERVEHAGVLGSVVKTELIGCLGRIVEGECPHYTKISTQNKRLES